MRASYIIFLVACVIAGCDNNSKLQLSYNALPAKSDDKPPSDSVKKSLYTVLSGAEAESMTRLGAHSGYGYPPSSQPVWLTKVGNRIFFLTNTSTENPRLWVTDGSAKGTKCIQKNANCKYVEMVRFKDALFFIQTVDWQTVVWKVSKGSFTPSKIHTSEGNRITFRKLLPFEDQLFLLGGGNDFELISRWDSLTNKIVEAERLDRTRVRDVYAKLRTGNSNFFMDLYDSSNDQSFWYYSHSQPVFQKIGNFSISKSWITGDFLVVDSVLYTSVKKELSNGRSWTEMVKINGSNGMVIPITLENNEKLIQPQGIAITDNYLVFSALKSSEYELPGAPSYTFSYHIPSGKLNILHKNPPGTRPRFSPCFNNKGRLFFKYGENTTIDGFDYELWSTDGTVEGTEFVHDIWVWGNYYINYNFTHHGDDVYFTATNTKHGFEIWKLNSVDKTIQMVTNFEHRDNANYIENVTLLNNKLVFVHTDLTHGTELWIYDEAGPRLLVDIN